MTESKLIQKRWLKAEGLTSLPRTVLEKVVLACSGTMSLRITHDSNHLEILSNSQQEFNENEALVHQALADENLRERIRIECNQEINLLINGILTKA